MCRTLAACHGRLICAVAVCFMLVFVAQYVDDFPLVDVADGGDTAQAALRAIFLGFGWDIEPKKRRLAALYRISFWA